MWTQDQAIALCREIERIAPEFGCHVALTGGLLYKDGPRKDCDLVFYRIRQRETIDVEALFRALRSCGLRRVTDGDCFVIKAKHEHGDIDCLFPEAESGHYIEDDGKPAKAKTPGWGFAELFKDLTPPTETP